MDDADITGDRAEHDHKANLARSRKPVGPQPKGFCHFCDAEVRPGARFCDQDCLSDWEREQSRMRINGVIDE